MMIFFRLMKATILYRSTLYSRPTQTDSSYVKYLFNDELAFGKVYCYIQVSNCLCKSYCNNECRAPYYAIITKCNITSKFHSQNGTSRIFQFVLTENAVAVEVRNLICVCFYVKIETLEYVIEPINS